MNKGLFALAGFVLGAACGIIGTKLYLEEKVDARIDEELEQIRDTYGVVVDDDLEDVKEEVDENGDISEKEFMRRSADDYTDYTKYAEGISKPTIQEVVERAEERKMNNVFDKENQVPMSELIDILDTDSNEVQIPEDYSIETITYYHLDSEFRDENGDTIDSNIEDWLGEDAYDLLTGEQDDVSIINHANQSMVDVIFNAGSYEQDLNGEPIEEELEDLNESEFGDIEQEAIGRLRKASGKHVK